jgi:carboxymethylenebutenolidase
MDALRNYDHLLISTRTITGGTTPVDAYLVEPVATGHYVRPGVLIVHEGRGLTPYVRAVATRVAELGYVALAPDLLSPVGGADSFSDPELAAAALRTLDRDHLLRNLEACLDYLGTLDAVETERLGVIGFCFGGGMAWSLATHVPTLRAVVAYCGSNPPIEDVPRIGAAMFAVYADRDGRNTTASAAMKSAMQQGGKVFEMEIFRDADCAFHNDTDLDRYNRVAAGEAWTKTARWLATYL